MPDVLYPRGYLAAWQHRGDGRVGGDRRLRPASQCHENSGVGLGYLSPCVLARAVLASTAKRILGSPSGCRRWWQPVIGKGSKWRQSGQIARGGTRRILVR